VPLGFLFRPLVQRRMTAEVGHRHAPNHGTAPVVGPPWALFCNPQKDFQNLQKKYKKI
jgi:hypothetical protein